MTEMNIREAIAYGLRESLNEDERVFLLGEDIGAYGGAYAVTKGFLAEFGPNIAFSDIWSRKMPKNPIFDHF